MRLPLLAAIRAALTFNHPPRMIPLSGFVFRSKRERESREAIFDAGVCHA